jgi:predicted ATPase/DNA-binding CsgD family transcriptional regulator
MTDKLSNSSEHLSEPLSERELEILACLADGFSNQEIANKLFLAEQTVRWYNSQIYSKLAVGNRKEAIARAKTLGLLDKAPPSSAATVIAGKHNLPAQSTPFVGRQQELDEISALLNHDHTRLITILAPGGMGKTRLALEAARLQIGRYADGVIFVPLAPLSSPSDIVTTIAENIGFGFYGENLPAQQLTDFLRERSMLLVLDNFEHLLEGAQLIADLMQAAPNVHILTTSRERLNLQGETVYSLRGLEFPTWETPEDALQYDAVKLFMQKAHRVRPAFELQPHDLDYLARICRLTAGMPLGIELAAGWVDVLSLEEIAAEIQKGIDILETEMRDVPERQRSIRATFDHTWERLTEDEKTVFMRLSIFRGGFTVAAAQTIAGASVRSLRQLTNKALVQVAPDGRHDIHELLRQFGAEKLATSGEEATLRPKHAAYFADFMAERKQDIRTNRQLEALELIDPDFENVRSAWLYVVNQQEWDQLPKFLHSLWFYCDTQTRGQEAVELLEQAVKTLQSTPSTDVTELTMGRVLARLGWFYHDTGFAERSVAVCDQAIRILHQQDSPEDLIAALYGRNLVGFFIIKPGFASNISQEGLSVARSIGDQNWEGHFLIWSGWTSIIINADFASALQFAEKGLAIFEFMGDRWGLERTYHLLSFVKLKQNKYEQAQQWCDKAIVLAQLFGHSYSIAVFHCYMGSIAFATSSYHIARLHFTQALRGFWDAGYKWRVNYPMTFLAKSLGDQNELERALEILAAIHKYSLGDQQIIEDYQALCNNLKAKLEPDRFAAVWARGEGRELSAVVMELLAELEEA